MNKCILSLVLFKKNNLISKTASHILLCIMTMCHCIQLAQLPTIHLSILLQTPSAPVLFSIHNSPTTPPTPRNTQFVASLRNTVGTVLLTIYLFC